MKCSNCGAEIADDSLFCPECGSKVDNNIDVTNEMMSEDKTSNTSSGSESIDENNNNVSVSGNTDANNQETVNSDFANNNAQNNYFVQPVNSSNMPLQAGNNPVNKIKKENIIIGACGAFVLFILLICLIANHKPTIDLAKYYEVEFTGYDGYGSAQYEFNEEKFKKDYGNKMKLSREFKSTIKKAVKSNDFDTLMGLAFLGLDGNGIDDVNELAYQLFKYSFIKQAELSETGNLKNGDTVTLTWDVGGKDYKDFISGYDKLSDEKKIQAIAELSGVKVKLKEAEYTVEGLDIVPLFDAFEDVELTFEGYSPNGSLNINYPSDNGLYYKADKNSGLKNGDTVTVSIDYYPESYAQQYNKLPKEIEKTYTVSGLSEYITTASQVSEKALNEMIEQAKDTINSETATWEKGFKLDISYAGNYFITSKKPSDTFGDQNQFTLVMKCHYTNSYEDYEGKNNEVTQDFYIGFTYSDLAVLDDGTTLYDPFGYKKLSNSFVISTGIFQDYSDWWGELDEVKLHFPGYEKLDSIYDICITSNLESYNYEENIEE